MLHFFGFTLLYFIKTYFHAKFRDEQQKQCKNIHLSSAFSCIYYFIKIISRMHNNELPVMTLDNLKFIFTGISIIKSSFLYIIYLLEQLCIPRTKQ